jgi:hypothetical protein
MAAQQIPAAERRLYRLWRALPTGPLSERELWDAICAAADQPGDQGFAQAIVANLLMPTPVRVDGELTWQRALTLREDDRGKLIYQRTEEYPVGEDTSFGTPAFNEVLAARAAKEREDLDRLDADRQRRRDESPWAIIERGRLEGVREVIRNEGGALLREAIREQVLELLGEIDQREEIRAAVLELLGEIDRPLAARLRAQLKEREQRRDAA